MNFVWRSWCAQKEHASFDFVEEVALLAPPHAHIKPPISGISGAGLCRT